MKLRIMMTLVVSLGLAGSLFAADPLVGAWKLNVAKSKFAGPIPRFRELTTMYQEQDGTRGNDAEGKPYKAVWVAERQ